MYKKTISPQNAYRFLCQSWQWVRNNTTITFSLEVGFKEPMRVSRVVSYLWGCTGSEQWQNLPWAEASGDAPGWGRGGSSPVCVPLEQLRSRNFSLGNVPCTKRDVWNLRSVPSSCCTDLNHSSPVLCVRVDAISHCGSIQQVCKVWAELAPVSVLEDAQPGSCR